MRTIDIEERRRSDVPGRRAGMPPGRGSDVPVFRAAGVLGNARTLRHDPVDLLMEAHAAAGDVVRIPVLPRLTVYSFAHPDAVRDVVMDRSGALAKGRSYAWLRRDLGTALLCADGAEHEWRRDALGPAFTRPAVLECATVMERSVAETVRRWSERRGGVVDVHGEVSELALRVICEVMFGDGVTTAPASMQRMFADGTQVLGELLGSVSQVLPRWVPTRLNRRATAVRAEIERGLTDAIEQRLLAHASRRDVIGHMVHPTVRGDGDRSARAYRTVREVLDEAKGMVGAGHETTANLLTWALYFLAIEREVDERAADEVRQVAGERPVSVADLEQLPYCRQVVHETLRLMPPSWAILRDAVREVPVAGTAVPRGALVVCCPYVTQRDPRWYPEPLRFLPDRAERHPEPPPFSFYPFGRGSRHCLGRTMAEVEAHLVVAELVRNFRFRVDAGRFVEPITRVAVKPVGGLFLRVEARKSDG